MRYWPRMADGGGTTINQTCIKGGSLELNNSSLIPNVEAHQVFFDLICPGCEDLNRPLIDDMLGSSE